MHLIFQDNYFINPFHLLLFWVPILEFLLELQSDWRQGLVHFFRSEGMEIKGSLSVSQKTIGISNYK